MTFSVLAISNEYISTVPVLASFQPSFDLSTDFFSVNVAFCLSIDVVAVAFQEVVIEPSIVHPLIVIVLDAVPASISPDVTACDTVAVAVPPPPGASRLFDIDTVPISGMLSAADISTVVFPLFLTSIAYEMFFLGIASTAGIFFAFAFIDTPAITHTNAVNIRNTFLKRDTDIIVIPPVEEWRLVAEGGWYKAHFQYHSLIYSIDNFQ